jgi:hypothetical protein
MKEEIRIALFTLLKNTPEVTAVIPAASITPLYAGENTNPPLIVYNINDVASASMDGLRQFDVFVVLVFPERRGTECAQMEDIVKAALADSVFEYRDSDTSVDEDNLNVVCAMRFETMAETEI